MRDISQRYFTAPVTGDYCIDGNNVTLQKGEVYNPRWPHYKTWDQWKRYYERKRDEVSFDDVRSTGNANEFGKGLG